MGRIVETKRFDDEGIITLWREAFDDSREDIEFFLDCCEYKSLVCYYNDNEQLCSMLFLVDASVNGERYKYIYAASTLKEYQQLGLMTKLLDFVKDNYSRVLLIPAESHLVDYYKKRNFTKQIDINNIRFFEIEDIEEYLFEGCELSEPFALAYIRKEQ